jgi:co-chaperonin GroES (HSP10)
LGKKYTAALKVSFPDVDPGIIPFGYLVLVQLRTPRKLTKGGLIIPDEVRDAERFRVQTGLVRSLGPSSFRNRQTGAPWIEGNWCNPGDFIRLPMYAGDRWVVPVPGGETPDEFAIFMMCKDTDLIGKVTADPLSVVTS